MKEYYEEHKAGIITWGAGILGIILCIFFIKVVLAPWLAPMIKRAMADQEIHQKFLDNHCKITEKVEGSVSYGTASIGGHFGTVSTYNPGYTSYTCDDGTIYKE